MAGVVKGNGSRNLPPRKKLTDAKINEIARAVDRLVNDRGAAPWVMVITDPGGGYLTMGSGKGPGSVPDSRHFAFLLAKGIVRLTTPESDS